MVSKNSPIILSVLNVILKILKFFILLIFSTLAGIFLFASEAMSGVNKNNKKRKGNTVVDRNVIGANWQTFLQDQKMETKKISGLKKEIQLEVNGYYKALRSDKQNGVQIKDNIKNDAAGKSGVKRNQDGSPVLTRYVAIDCEMVGIGDKALDHMLARVSIVNKFGDCLYDKFVQPREKVTDYRTSVSGVRKEDLLNGERFEVVQKEVAEILNGRFLVGHAVKHDLDVLFLSHPASKIRDTSKYKPFRSITKGKTPSLKKLSEVLLGVDIQSGEHSSVEDARATMQLYSLHAHNWEEMLKKRQKRRNKS